MDTLSNVYSREGGNLLSSARLIPCTISCQNKTGVSVENAQQNSEDTSQQKQMKQWFVLRVAYHHEQIAKDWLAKVGITSYLPMHYVVKEINGRKKRVQNHLFPIFSLLKPQKKR